MKVVTFILVVLFFNSCKNKQNHSDRFDTEKSPRITKNVAIDKNFTYHVINSPGNTFGYRIFSNHKLLIHQSSIPGLPGNKGFDTKIAAKKVVQLVISKLRKGEIPPTVSTSELKQLKVIE